VVANDLPEAERANARPYLARTLSEQFRETFFAKSVLLTEGPSDAAVLETAAELLGLGSLAADGVVITNVGGKGSQPVALAILDALGIPTFCVFDGDGDSRDGDACETCGRAKRDRTSAAASNRKILASLGGPEIDFPPNTVEARWACFETEIEDVIEGFRKILSEVQNEMSWKRKAPVAYAETVRRPSAAVRDRRDIDADEKARGAGWLALSATVAEAIKASALGWRVDET
jgi:predicted ATP-dependent endonuclease of OLD family